MKSLHVDPKKIYVLCFPKCLLTDIFKNMHLETSRNRRQIFQNEYFYLIYVICLERHKKKDKLERKTNIRKKDGSHHFIQVHWRRPIRKWEKNIRYPYPFEQRYSLKIWKHSNSFGAIFETLSVSLFNNVWNITDIFPHLLLCYQFLP